MRVVLHCVVELLLLLDRSFVDLFVHLSKLKLGSQHLVLTRLKGIFSLLQST